MAYQPKSYKKFVATAATATLVASAVAPVASAAPASTASFTDVAPQYKEAVDYLVTNNISSGLTETQFGVYENITRGDAAIQIASALGLKDNKDAAESGFSDVPTRGVLAINALKAAGIVSGKTTTNFGFYDNITRGEMALILVKANAYNLKGDVSKLKFTDVADRYKEAVAALVDAGITSGVNATQFGTNNPITRGDFARFIFKAETMTTALPAVSALEATGPNTITVSGSDLKGLKAENISIDGNTVSSVVASEDGKSATITLANPLTEGTEYKVTVKINEVSTDYTVKFNFSIKSVSLDEKTYDDDTAGQKLSFKINGNSATADTEWLRQAGYTVKFYAVDSTNTAANIFTGSSNESSTGLLLSDINTTGDYTVEVQIMKDGNVVVSDTSTISIQDLESVVSAISFVNFANSIGFDHNSTTLVTGENATIDYVEGSAAGKSDVQLDAASTVVSSSNPAIVSVSGQTLTANAPGNATITVKIGDVEKTFNFTVTNSNRLVAKVTPSESTVKVVNGETRYINVVATDQYGDPILVDDLSTTHTVVEDLPKNSLGNDLVTVGTAADNDLTTTLTGKHSGFEVTGVVNGSGSVLFKNAAGTVIGKINVTVTGLDNVNSNKLEFTFDSESKDNDLVLGKSTDDTLKYQVSLFNTENAYNGVMPLAAATDADTNGVVDAGFFPAAAGSYYVVSSDPSVATVGVAANELTVTAAGTGSADVVVYDNNGLVKHKFTVKVTANPVITTGVKFVDTATINYINKAVDIYDFLDVRTDGVVDPIVYGVTHNEATAMKVRLDSSSVANDENGNALTATDTQPVLYIDNDNNGARDAGEVVLAVVTATPLSGESLANMTAGTDIDLINGSGVTASGDKGTLLFRVIDDKNANGTYDLTETIVTKTLDINVK